MAPVEPAVDAAAPGTAPSNYTVMQEMTILESNNPMLDVSYTLPVLPAGLNLDGGICCRAPLIAMPVLILST
ncbi:hypothetical protein O0544_20305 [Edwardsiella anguillarum]|nr:hypothetical protein [Edwardsiella anguillarum]